MEELISQTASWQKAYWVQMGVQAQAKGRWICGQVQGKAGGQGLLTAART